MMSETNPAGKSRPARPPVPQKRPTKPPKPVKATKPVPNETASGVEDTVTVKEPNHIKPLTESSNGPPVTPPKPKLPPVKPGGKAASTDNVVNDNPEIEKPTTPEVCEDKIDGDLKETPQHLADSNKSVEDTNGQGVLGSPNSGSPRIPPRRFKTPRNEQSEDVGHPRDAVTSPSPGGNNSLPNSAAVSRSSSSCSNSGERPQTRPKPPRKKPPPPSDKVLASITSETQNGETPAVERSSSLSDGVNEVDSEKSSVVAQENIRNIKQPSTDSSGIDVGKKASVKPKPNRPPPPLKRPSQLSSKPESVDIPTKRDDQVPKVKPKPVVIKPKPSKPVRLTLGGDAVPGNVGNAVKQEPLRKQQEAVAKKEEKVTVGNVVNSSSSKTASQPLPPPRRKRLSLIGMESQESENVDEEPVKDAETEKTEKDKPTRPAPVLSKSAKRSSNGTIFAVIGESKSPNVKDAESNENAPDIIANNEGMAENPVNKVDLKPKRVAPAKPPPPSPQALMKQKSMNQSPSPSPSRKAQEGSPRKTPTHRPQAPPPPVPKVKKPDQLEKGSTKTPPKRPQPPNLTSIKKGVKEDASKLKSPSEETKHPEGEDVTAEEKVEEDVASPPPRDDGQDSDVFSTDTSAAEDRISGESKEEPFSSRGESLIDGDDDDDDFSSDEFSDDERSRKSEDLAVGADDDAAFISTLTKERKKAYQVAKEIRDSEAVFVDVLRLLNEDFKGHIEFSKDKEGQPVIEKVVLDQILGYLPQLQMFNEELLNDFKDRISKWPENPKIADVFIKKGPYLKLYTTYIQDFEKLTAELEDACNKYPSFKAEVQRFEASKRCQSLQVRHYMLKPVQRIPQYRLLLTDYQKNLEEGSVDEEDTKAALNIVSQVASHVNNLMKSGDDLEKLLSIQHSLLGQHDIVKPGRTFLKEGVLNKISRKEFQQRKLFLLSDVLLTTASFPSGLRLKAELPLEGMKVTEPQQTKDHENEFNIISVERSFTLAASSPEEKEEWVTAIKNAVAAVMEKRSTFMSEEVSLDEFVLGNQAPVWIPDARVTMCQICTSEFTITWRRHHCRACGKVICGNCSKNKVYLEYLKKIGRVCDECQEVLGVEEEKTPSSGSKVKRRKSHVTPSKPKILKEVSATDDDITIKGYLQHKEKRSWKRMWFVVKDKVLYTYKASEDVAAERTFPLIGFQLEVKEGEIKLHQGKVNYLFKADTQASADEWIAAFREATQLS